MKKQNRRFWGKSGIAALLVVLFAAGLLAGCGEKESADEPAPIPDPVIVEEPVEPEPEPEPYGWPLTGIEYGKVLPGEEEDMFRYPL
ncbi:MAG: hypothetical protein LBR00_06265, partial [Clostridiales Family XIII bacterium]|nr:hypothetical protein [Clostridiales Family XIII bacterium]